MKNEGNIIQIVTLSVFLFFTLTSGAKKLENQPNILFIISDDLRTELGC
jgi:hypothetical protein